MSASLPHRWSLAHNYLAGITAGAWWRLLRENRFAISPAYWHRAAFITLSSLLNSWHARRESRQHGAAVSKTRITQPPVFILGHWRSGTTHLHNLLALDESFAFANTYQVVNPATFLTTEEVRARRYAWMVPPKRLMDNMALSFAAPQEEEFAPALASLRSLYLGMSFPRRMAHYERHLTFDGCPEDARAWQEGLRAFCQKLTYKYGEHRPLLLKSPPNTARVRLLLELFPDARFIHIHRHPHEVYRSQLHFYNTVLWHTYLQRPDRSQLAAEVLARYRTVFDALFRDLPLIPNGRLHELSFDELERDPVGSVARSYAALELPHFDTMRPKLEQYTAGLRGYEKNKFAPLDPATRARVNAAAAPVLERYGYTP
ncbi:MAG TPA: sulfotransferase [Candidatus Synoicihabitans sp.]|nr:sulfotransferase [Candidatus Synoicihabitans sp.]